MELTDPRTRNVFFDIHDGLPREGPGNQASTARALALAGPLPTPSRVLDIGCGPGMQTMDLAFLLPDAEIIAIDNHIPFVEATHRRAIAAGVDEQVRALAGDMKALDFPDASFDLIWCEGGAYLMGVEAALSSWRRLLKPDGRLAFTEAVWLTPDPPAEARAFWAEYPGIGDVEACRALAARAGYRLLGDFVLPEAAWWQDYYTPMAQRLELLEAKYAERPPALEVLATSRHEIEIYRRHADAYGYLFLVLALAESGNSQASGVE
jgi:SAM-dependent methyltransferase